MQRVHLTISGRVQGVFFRHHTSKVANQLSLTGFIRNLDNGDVEVIAEGEESKIERLIEFCKKGPNGAYVTNVEIRYDKPKNEFAGFNVNY